MDSLYDFFRIDLQPALIKQERQRKLVVRDSYLIYGVVFLLASIPIIDWVRKVGLADSLFIIPILYMPAFALAYFLRRGLVLWHKESVKQATIARVVNFIEPELEYRARASVSRSSVVSSGLFGYLSSDFYMKGEDRITGQLHGLGFSYSEISIKSDPLISGDTGLNDFSIFRGQLFRGFFAEIELNRYTDSLVYIYPNNLKKNVTNVLKDHFVYSDNTATTLERIKVEDPVFERYFNVFANDQLQSRMILTTTLINDITRFREKMASPIMLSIKNNKLYIAVPSSQDLFEPNVFQSYLDPAYVRQYIRELKIVTELVKDVHHIFREV